MKIGSFLVTLGSLITVWGCTQVTAPDAHFETAITNMDRLQEELASRSRKSFPPSPDFQIVVTQAAYPIGTILRQGSTIPVEYAACAPSSQPPKAAAPSLFPNYSLSQGAAVDFGLDNALLSVVAGADAKFSRTQTVALSFKNTYVVWLADGDIARLSKSPACAAVLSAGPHWLVRGYVFGQRKFSLVTERARDIKAKITKVANFDVNLGSGNAALDIVDDQDVGFLQVVSEVSLPAGERLTSIIALKPPSAGVQTQGRVYIQQDRNDRTTTGSSVLASLRSASFNVVPQIERIESSKMPNVAQVRYFNATDDAVASKALSALKRAFPDAKLVQVKLPAPTGQLEVWLPKVS